MSGALFNYYDPDLVDAGFVEGIYPAHIVKLESKSDIIVKQKHLAIIYNLTLRVAPDVTSYTYTSITDDGEKKIKGDNYIGKEIKSSGLFFFITPTKSTHRHLFPNAGGNRRYYEFLRMIGVECPEKSIEIAGSTKAKPLKKKLPVLPYLSLSDVMGKPVLAVVRKSEWEGTDKDGNPAKFHTHKAFNFEPWLDGQDLDIEEALPF